MLGEVRWAKLNVIGYVKIKEAQIEDFPSMDVYAVKHGINDVFLNYPQTHKEIFFIEEK